MFVAHLALTCRSGIDYRINPADITFTRNSIDGRINAHAKGIGLIRLPDGIGMAHVDYALAACARYGAHLGVIHLGKRYGCAQLPPPAEPPPLALSAPATDNPLLNRA